MKYLIRHITDSTGHTFVEVIKPRENERYEIVSVYGDNKKESMLQTSTNAAEALMFDDYNESLETAKEYNLEVKKIRTDIVGLGSKWHEDT